MKVCLMKKSETLDVVSANFWRNSGETMLTKRVPSCWLRELLELSHDGRTLVPEKAQLLDV